MSIGNSIGDSIGLSIGQSIGELGIVPDTLAHFDETTILGANPVTEWRNKGRGSSPFDLDIPVGTAANLTTLDTGVALLAGTAGDFFSTPDSAAASITGDIDIRVRVAMADWTPGAVSTLTAKTKNTTNRAYRFDVRSDGRLHFLSSPDGSVGNEVGELSVGSTGFTNGTVHWVRVTLDVNDGAGNRVYEYFTSDDDVEDSDDVTTWTQLGTTITTAGVTTIVDNDSPVEIGSFFEGTGQLLAGKVHRAQIYDTIDGTSENVDFDPSKATVNTATFVSDTGETWTANGDAFVNATGHTGILDRGGVGFETTAGQDVTEGFTRFIMLKPILAAPGADQFVFDARSDATKSVRVFSDETNSDKWTLDAGGTPIALSQAYSNDLQLFIIEYSEDASSKLTVGANSVTGDAGSEDLDFGSSLKTLSDDLQFECVIFEDVLYDRLLSAAEITRNKNFLEADYKI